MKAKSILSFSSITFSALFALFSCSSPKPSAEVIFPEDHSDMVEWRKDARFGMFIHWGPVSLKGTEIGWSRGRRGTYEIIILQSYQPTI